MLREFKRLLLLVFILFYGMLAYGQHSLTLSIVDREGGNPISFAKLSLIDESGKLKLEGVSDKGGKCKFILADSLNGKLRISTAVYGYQNHISLIKFATKDLFDTIYLVKNTHVLSEVIVVQQKTVKDGEKLVYRPKNDQFSKATGIVELFSRLPGVSLSSGKLKLHGSDGVLLLVDGKGELKSQSQQIQMLEALSSDKVEKIEIISTSSSRYDANITSIINIIMKKNKGSSSVKASVVQPVYMNTEKFGSDLLAGGASTNLNFKIHDIRASFIFTANNTKRLEDSRYEKSIYNLLKYNSITNSITSRLTLSPNLSLDYDVNSRSSISLNADISVIPSLKRNTIENYDFRNYESNRLDSAVVVDNKYKNARSNILLSGNYKYTIDKKKNSNLYFNVIYSYNPYSVSNYLNSFSNANGISTISNSISSNTNIINASLIISDLISWPMVSTEFGIKSNSLRNETGQSLNSVGSEFNYNEQLSSAFFSTRFKFEKYLLNAGIRAELLNSTSFFNQNNTFKILNQNYVKIYPYLLLQRSFDRNLTASIGYSKKIKRPFVSDLNPSGRINSFVNTLEGNLDYKPIYSNRIETQIRYKDLGVTFYYEQSSAKFLFLPTDDPFKFKATSLNKLHKFAVAVDKSFEVFSFLNSNINANYSYSQHGSGDILYYNKRLNLFEVSGSGDFILGKKTKLQAEFYYTAKMKTEYSVFGGLFSNSVTLKQLLFRDKWNMNLIINDPIGLEKNKSLSFYNNQFAEGLSISNQRSIALQVTYVFPFGQKFKNQKYKKVNDGEIRDQQ